MTMTAASAKQEATSSASPQQQHHQIEQQLALNQFTEGQQQIQLIASSLGELELSRQEMTQVLEILRATPKERRCWYNMDGIMIEMTVGEVLPKIAQDMAILTSNINTISKDIDTKRDILANFAIEQKLVRPIYKDKNGNAKNTNSKQLPAISEAQAK